MLCRPVRRVDPRPRRRAISRPAGCALVAVLALAAASCGTDAPSQRELAEALVDSGVPRAAADCAADALTSTLTDQQLADLAERGNGAAPVDDPDRTDDTADQLREALGECRTLIETTTTTVPAEDGSSTTVPDDGAAPDDSVGDGPATTVPATTAPATTAPMSGDPDGATIDSTGP